ncbi:uncharacterized protein LOC143127315 isoform X2 [Alosa pseudoharengus]|uniref:uncharacterized protein LOC143127315 isoform X2 n=1 Tax=Alosa pseudoharengus TaxID=34774 RepID=UPI003F8BA7AE
MLSMWGYMPTKFRVPRSFSVPGIIDGNLDMRKKKKKKKKNMRYASCFINYANNNANDESSSEGILLSSHRDLSHTVNTFVHRGYCRSPSMAMRKWTYCLPLVLVSLSLALASHEYHYIVDPKTWTEAQTYCREKYTDLATIRDKEEMQRLNKLILTHNINSNRAWIGLYNQHDKSSDFEGWPQSPENCSLSCVVWYGGSWWGVPCQSSFLFFCSTGTQNPSHSFVRIEKPKTWMDAQSYCQETQGQLATTEGLKADDRLVNDTDKAIWVNLQGRNWTWSDGYEPSFTYWRRNWPSTSMTCATVSQQDPGSPVTAKRLMVRVEIQMDSSLDPSDEKFQTIFLNQIREKLPAHTKLTWIKLPDGQIFHKKNEKGGNQMKRKR